jgi:hypothetical protein
MSAVQYNFTEGNSLQGILLHHYFSIINDFPTIISSPFLVLRH